MSREKQIEEMASIINGSLCSEYYPEPIYIPSATELYNAGYRKQSEVASEIFEELEKNMVTFGDVALSSYFKGIGWKHLKELKKKYTEPDV